MICAGESITRSLLCAFVVRIIIYLALDREGLNGGGSSYNYVTRGKGQVVVKTLPAELL